MISAIKMSVSDLLLILMIFSLVSCFSSSDSGQEEESAENGETNTETQSETEKETESEEQRMKREIADIISSMTLRELICQMIIVNPEKLSGNYTDTTAGEEIRSALGNYPVGGIIFFGNNIVDPAQVSAMIESLQSASRIPLFISVDEEGGVVSRIASNPAMGTTAFSSMLSIGNSGDPRRAYEVGLTIGREIKQFGFNLDFAPVADIYSNPSNTVIGYRAFGRDASTVSDMVSYAVKGFNDSGILCTLKHFPGHGDTSEDTHYTSAVSYKTLEQLETSEFLPFASGINAGAPVVMLSHILTPNVTDSTTPASLSSFMTGYLRNNLHFEGLIITDSLAMRAIADYYNSYDTAVMAVNAGADILLIPDRLDQAVAGIEGAVAEGRISMGRLYESVERILKYKIMYGIIEG